MNDEIQDIHSRIHTIRGQRVMLDRDLAFLYETDTKVLNLAVKRNSKRFPEDFMFRLTSEESEFLRFQIETLEITAKHEKSKNTRDGRGKFAKYLPYAFTEQGIAMLSGVLRSDKAVCMNIAIMRAFVQVRRIVNEQVDIKDQLREIKLRLGEHDVQLSSIYDALENILDENSRCQKWQEREKIGFNR